MLTKKLKKAVFPVAGLGTRFLPVTKTIPKELLPIVYKPLLQYAVEEAVDAGIDTLIFITGKNKRAIEDHFDRNKELEENLEKMNKNKQAEELRGILPKDVECIFVRQAEPLGLGHAISCVKRIIRDEPFAVLLADDFFPNDKTNVTKELIESFKKTGKVQLSVMEVDGPQISDYGVVKLDGSSGKVIGLVEKPDFANAPSNLASIGRYILIPDVFEVLEGLVKGKNNEIQLADALNKMAKDSNVEMVTTSTERFDCGSVKGYLEANLFVAKKNGLL